MASSKYFRQARARKLVAALKYITLAKIHLGAGESEDHHFDYNAAYNTPRQREENEGIRTRSDIQAQGEWELSQAKAEFRQACRHCELAVTCGVKSIKESRFYELFDDKAARTRFRRRIKTKRFKNGNVTALCAVLLRAGHLDRPDDYIS